MGYLAYVVDTRVEERVLVTDVFVVREFLDVFFGGITRHASYHLMRQVEFRIDLILGVAMISKAFYRLAPPKIQKLSS